MKIAVVVSEFPTISETFIINQVVYLLDQGHDVTIFAIHKGYPSIEHRLITEYNLIEKCKFLLLPEKNYLKRTLQLCKMFFGANYVNWKAIFKIMRPVSDLRRNLRLFSFFRFQIILFDKFDIIHAHWAYNALDLALAKGESLYNAPLIVSFHGHDIIPTKIDSYKKTYRHFMKNVNLLIANSPYTKMLLEEVFNDKIIIKKLPVGLDTSKFSPGKIWYEGDTIKIIFVGRLINWKGPHIAIKAIEELVFKRGFKNIMLTIIGDGEEKESLIHMVEKLNLKDFVQLRGALTQEQIIDEMTNADLFLLPGITSPKDLRAETQGLVIQEAQSMQLPVLVSDAGGMKYGMIDGKTGFVVKEGDIIGFADKLEQLIHSRELRVSMGKFGRRFVQENFDLNVLGKDLLKIYNEAL